MVENELFISHITKKLFCLQVYDLMQEAQFFPTFKKSQNYIKLLAELDLLKEGNTKAEEESE